MVNNYTRVYWNDWNDSISLICHLKHIWARAVKWAANGHFRPPLFQPLGSDPTHLPAKFTFILMMIFKITLIKPLLAFDTIDPHTLLQILDHLIAIKTNGCWFKFYLLNRPKFVKLPMNLHCIWHSDGVPQGSVLRRILFTLFMLPFGKIIRKHQNYTHLIS